ncbi:acyltransferase family protein [Citrobacter farmeri]
MTKIIISRLDKKNFSLTGFYTARAKRIIPALAAIAILILLVGYLFLSPKDYIRLSQDAISSILFVSNFWYASNSGYFDASSSENFFLHTWSLSVEWQFYIIYPIILIAIYKVLNRKSAIASIYIMFVASLVFGVFYTYSSATYAYYMFPLRAWEMLAGGICFLHDGFVKKKKTSIMLEIFGVLIILTSFFIFDELTPWPGYHALAPVLGASLIILSNNQQSIFTGGILQQNIGRVSYSAYLVHWPVLVFFWKIGLTLNFAWYLLLVTALAVIINLLFERSRSINIKNCSVYLASMLGCFAVYSNNGYENRVPEEFRLSQAQFHGKYYGGSGFPANKIFYEHADRQSYKYIFTGDSFAAQYAKEIQLSGLPQQRFIVMDVHFFRTIPGRWVIKNLMVVHMAINS